MLLKFFLVYKILRIKNQYLYSVSFNDSKIFNKRVNI